MSMISRATWLSSRWSTIEIDEGVVSLESVGFATQYQEGLVGIVYIRKQLRLHDP